ncbi:amidase [Geodermatophilus marinus]|uniref:amidase n=1 Tax=Geodermatophilus sp. LHW52908 TaxID=2303986 RepID=UPI000E3C9F71|nr:amidase family protein [Geodermatophilus sp. LHW52908]RFU19276.1 amidase [Geodermatophilus sp. LHW52908]
MDASGGVGTAALVGWPATELAARVRAGGVSAVGVVRAHLAHLDAVDARIGAFRVVRREAALAEAAEVDADPRRAELPLAGVPVAVKDNVPVAGEACTDGSPACPLRVADADHPVVARLRAAGAVVVGLTRMPELGLYAATDGPGTVTRNPWDTALAPAGSSGGSAAAVAAGVVPLAVGNDGLGSLRLPAAACGLVTLKPGRGVVPTLAVDWSGMVQNGVLATTVGDVALGHAVLAGEQPGRPPGWERPLRVAVSTRSPVPGVRADGPTRAAVERVAAELAAAGHTVVRRDPPVPPSAALGVVARWLAGAADEAAHLGIPLAELQPRSRTHARLGRLARGAGLVRPADAERFRDRLTAFFDDDVDLLLGPVAAGPPLPARPWHERGFLANVTANTRWAAWAPAWNLAGLPALVLPAGPRPDGLPVGVQLAGPPGAETRLLWTAGELERRLPWRRHAPVFDPAAPQAPAPV